MASRWILVGGGYKTGKDTFLNTLLADFAVGGPVSFLYQLPVGEQNLLLLTTSPDASYLHFIEKSSSWKQAGCVIMMDSTRRDSIGDAFTYMQQLYRYCPEMKIAFAASMQDLPGAASPESIRSTLQISDDIPVLPCIATDRESVKSVLLALLKRMPPDELIEKAIAKVEAL